MAQGKGTGVRKRENCMWIVSSGRPVVFCGAPSTHYESEGAGQFCRQHSEDYEDVFGEVLREFPVEETEVKP